MMELACIVPIIILLTYVLQKSRTKEILEISRH